MKAVVERVLDRRPGVRLVEMMGHGGAAGMSMDAMVADMRNRFGVAALPSVPILLWSSIGRNVLSFTVAAQFGLRDGIWLLLSLPVIFNSAWIFVDGRSARCGPGRRT